MNVVLPGFSSRIKELRKEKHLRQVDMAELLGVIPRHYQKIEAGEINIPTVTLVKLADYFEVTTEYLLGRSDKRK